MRRWDPGGLLLASIIILGLYELLAPPRHPSQGVEVVIRPGKTASQVAQELHDLGLIASPRYFVILSRVMGIDRRLRSGVYILPQPSTESEVLKYFRSSPGGVKVVIPEGLTLKQVARILSDNEIVDEAEFLECCADPGFLKELGVEAKDLEGYLFPDTYHLSFNSDPRVVIRVMVENFFQVHKELTRAILPQLDLHEVVTLASLVEREAKLAAEREVIASVFLNRLRNHLPLQSCATIQYILGEVKPRLDLADLAIPSEYNTYLNPGLPPGPICSPGRAALKAVINPASTDYLYFVANPDGSHRFSTTAQEHDRNKRLIRKEGS
jgi:UPF0755 protein